MVRIRKRGKRRSPETSSSRVPERRLALRKQGSGARAPLSNDVGLQLSSLFHPRTAGSLVRSSLTYGRTGKRLLSVRGHHADRAATVHLPDSATNPALRQRRNMSRLNTLYVCKGGGAMTSSPGRNANRSLFPSVHLEVIAVPKLYTAGHPNEYHEPN